MHQLPLLLLFLTAFCFALPLSTVAAPFATLALKKAVLTMDKQTRNADTLTVHGEFALGVGNDGADPGTEAVTLKVGPFSTTLPPRSFTRKGGPQKFTWTFKAPEEQSSGIAKMTLTRAGVKWTVSATATGLDLSGTANPVLIGVQIGDEGDARIFTFARTDKPHKTVWRFPPRQLQTSLTASLTRDMQKPRADKFTLKGDFALDEGNDGINPRQEEVTLSVGPFSQSIPPGSFTAKTTTGKTTYTRV